MPTITITPNQLDALKRVCLGGSYTSDVELCDQVIQSAEQSSYLPTITDIRQMDDSMHDYLNSRVRRGWDLVLHFDARDRVALASRLEELALRIRDDDKLADGHCSYGSGGWWHLAISRWYDWTRDENNEPVATIKDPTP